VHAYELLRTLDHPLSCIQPATTPASTVDRQCGSSQQAVSFAAGLIAAGVHDVMIGAGVEHMGRIPMGSNVAHPEEFGTPFPPELMERYELIPQGLSAEMIAAQWEIPRHEQDALGLRSHQNAVRATDEGRFEREIIPLEADGELRFTDQGIRRETSLDQLAALKPAFKPDGTVTAGNSSQLSDGAAAVLLMARDKAEELGLEPRARITTRPPSVSTR
jgi:acetyl-CoA acyltransferase